MEPLSATKWYNDPRRLGLRKVTAAVVNDDNDFEFNIFFPVTDSRYF